MPVTFFVVTTVLSRRGDTLFVVCDPSLVFDETSSASRFQQSLLSIFEDGADSLRPATPACYGYELRNPIGSVITMLYLPPL